MPSKKKKQAHGPAKTTVLPRSNAEPELYMPIAVDQEGWDMLGRWFQDMVPSPSTEPSLRADTGPSPLGPQFFTYVLSVAIGIQRPLHQEVAKQIKRVQEQFQLPEASADILKRKYTSKEMHFARRVIERTLCSTKLIIKSGSGDGTSDPTDGDKDFTLTLAPVNLWIVPIHWDGLLTLILEDLESAKSNPSVPPASNMKREQGETGETTSKGDQHNILATPAPATAPAPSTQSLVLENTSQASTKPELPTFDMATPTPATAPPPSTQSPVLEKITQPSTESELPASDMATTVSGTPKPSINNTNLLLIAMDHNHVRFKIRHHDLNTSFSQVLYSLQKRLHLNITSFIAGVLDPEAEVSYGRFTGCFVEGYTTHVEDAISCDQDWEEFMEPLRGMDGGWSRMIGIRVHCTS
ncbi:hypothetical protein DFH27DRAFT_311504 [Peziza echinospora]|nr:hypothetical protein DFH27DRAFT_311504 [Peziza echinospora]